MRVTKPEPTSSLDLSRFVTVFVTTVGAPTFEACMQHLQRQDCRFSLEVIDHVAPMNVAFQHMLDECRTPYYVQVDEDMLLHPYAIRSLYERIEAGAPDVALCSAELYDVHLERCILGVKIFRHEIVRRYPLDAMDAFETHQVARLEADGWVVLRDEPGKDPVAGQTMGLHGTRWTPASIYERYCDLERRRQVYGRLNWFEPYASEFLRRFLAEPSEENFFALMGVVAGTLSSRNGNGSAKDYRDSAAPPGFAPLRRFFAELECNPFQTDAPDAADGSAPEEIEEGQPEARPRRRGNASQ